MYKQKSKSRKGRLWIKNEPKKSKKTQILGDITNVVNSHQADGGNFNESISPISEYLSEKINYDSCIT